MTTVTGGPFTDAMGNPLPGDFQFQPVADVDTLTDAAPHEVHGTLSAGAFSVPLAPGQYTFRLTTETEAVCEPVTVPDVTTVTVEALSETS